MNRFLARNCPLHPRRVTVGHHRQQSDWSDWIPESVVSSLSNHWIVGGVDDLQLLKSAAQDQNIQKTSGF